MSTTEDSAVVRPTSLSPKEANAKYIEVIQDNIKTNRKLVNFLKYNHLSTYLSQEQADDFLTVLPAMSSNLRIYINKRQKIPIHAQTMFVLLHGGTISTHELFGQFYSKFNEALHSGHNRSKLLIPMSRREIRRYLERDISILDKNLEFANADSARLFGFYGQQCKHCGSYRTKISLIDTNLIYCVRCVYVKGPEERIQILKCPECKNNTVSDGDICDDCSTKE